MSYIQLPYGYVNKQKQIPYLTTKDRAVENNLINLIKNRVI